ncbi:MAG: DUF3857 domain-containing protein [Paludibacter sp.]|nr:DUF3857 domain-containing protein [Paludibacter sp.]
MKKLCIFIISNFLFLMVIQSQEISLKYGKVTTDELNMKVYPKDTTAEAVVLYDDGYASYEYLTSVGFMVELQLKKKIKILKPEGVDEATISIPYYSNNAGDRESVVNLEAYAYNLENGKIVKTKLEKKYIFDEELSSKYRQLKFSIPNVKVGTVIELKYTKSSNRIYEMPDWQIQSDIPVINSLYEVRIPEYFIFNMDTKGYESIKVAETSENQTFNLGSDSNGSNTVTCTSRDIKFTAKDVPALKDEENVWCVEDYMSGVRFELNGTKFPNDFYRPYTQTWEDLEKTLKDKSDMGSNLKMSDPYKDEIKALVSSTTDEKKKIEMIYSFIKDHIRWDESYSFYGNKAKEAVKNRTGDNGQINMVLISALKDAGITAYPILISRRSQGRLPYTFPSYNKLTTFIVAAKTTDGTTYYMDGSAIYGGLNMLPINLLVDRGRVFEESESEKWVDLTKIAKNQQVFFLMTTLENDGTLKGDLKTAYTNQLAYSYKSSYQAAKDSTEFIEKFQNANQITVDSFKIEGKEPMSSMVKEEIKFTKNYEVSGDYLYINPMIFPHITKNAFTQSDRKLPVEFNYPYVFQISCSMKIPDNYKIEELPKSIKIVLEDNKGKCLYQVIQDGNKIQLNYRFELNNIIFSQMDYTAVRDFYGQVVNKNTEMIVLKKI